MFIVDLIIFILVLGVIILIHELGHFYFAKKAGILCHEFSIGMGPAIYQKRKGETVYSIRGIPIGGYVSMAGESINDALIKKEQVIGVKINEQGQIYQINLNSELKSDQVGIVKAYDLYGKDFNPLFITLEVDGTVQSYQVLRDAVYKINEFRELWITPSEKSFESKTLWQRFLVIFAGPFMNFLLAIVIYLIVGFFIFKPTLSSSEIGDVGQGTPVATLGLQAGDVVTQINGKPITDWNDLSKEMAIINNTHMSLSYQREGVTYTLSDVPVIVYIQMAGISNTFTSEDSAGNVVYNIYNDEPRIGTVFGRANKGDELKNGDLITLITIGSAEYPITHWNDIIDVFENHRSGTIKMTFERTEDGQTTTKTKTYDLISDDVLEKLGASAMVFQMGVTPQASFDLLYSLKYPFTAFYGNMRSVIVTIGLLFTPSANLGLGDLSGPIGIFTLVSSTASLGLLPLLSFTAFLSINIGMLNLLPIPALDGGRLVFLGYEAITRKPLNKKFENTVNNIMFILLLILFVYVAFNDIFG
jgi:regulator of sigma E protease